MFKYAKIVNEETKLCEVGTGTNEKFYKSIGFKKIEVEQAYDGKWYVKGYAPEKPAGLKASEIRSLRDKYLQETDKYMLSDYPVSDEERRLCQSYRAYLRDVPDLPEFPDVSVPDFDEWLAGQTVVEEENEGGDE